MISPEIMPTQSDLPFREHGGRRKGAGRPRGRRVSHARRPRFARVTPVHVTLRMLDHVWNLRSRRSFCRIRQSFENSRPRRGLRIIEFSVQGNHVHVIAEADDNLALTRGIQGLAIRIAKALNAMMRAAGKVFADHYHARLLRSPTELVRALRYVLNNAAHHFGTTKRDPYCSVSFEPHRRAAVLAEARGWLLRVGLPRAMAG